VIATLLGASAVSADDEPAGGYPPADEVQRTIRVKVQDADTVVGQETHVKLWAVNVVTGLSGGTMVLRIPARTLDFVACIGCFVPPVVEQSQEGRYHLVRFAFVDLNRHFEGVGDFHFATMTLRARTPGHPALNLVEVVRMDDDGGFPLVVNQMGGTVFIGPEPVGE
jgi:hypothetical protein